MERVYSRPRHSGHSALEGGCAASWALGAPCRGSCLRLPCGTLQGRGHTWASPGPICSVFILETGYDCSVGGMERIADQEDKTQRCPQIILRPHR